MSDIETQEAQKALNEFFQADQNVLSCLLLKAQKSHASPFWPLKKGVIQRVNGKGVNMTNIGPFSQKDLDTFWAMSDAQKRERDIQVLSDDEVEQAMTINTFPNDTISVRRNPHGRWQDMNVWSITEYDNDEKD